MNDRLIRCALLTAMVLAAACGGDDSPTAPADVACTVELTGGITSSLSCGKKVAGLYTTSTDSTVLSGSVQGSPSLAVNISVKGVPVAGTIHSNDVGARGFVSSSTDAGGWIAQTTGTIGGGAAIGSWTLVLSSVSVGVTDGANKTYVVHGTLDATMNKFGGGAAVTAHVIF